MRLSEGSSEKKKNRWKRCRGTGAAAAERWGMSKASKKKNQSAFFSPLADEWINWV